MNDLIKGFSYLRKGISLLSHPKIRHYLIAPFIINLLIFIGFWWLGIHYFHYFTEWVNQHLPQWLQFLSYLLWILFFLTSLILTSYLFALFTNLIAAPFSSLLSEQVESLVSRQPIENVSWGTTFARIPASLKRQLQIMLYSGARLIIFVILFFIPLIHPLVSIAWFLYGSWLTALQYLDYPMDNHQISFAKMREMLGQKRMVTEGFGMACLMMTFIPILNFFVIPAAVAGATVLWLEEFKN